MSRKPRLSLESLESKVLLNGGPPVPPGISLSAVGVLNIKCGDSDDFSHVWVANGQVHANLGHMTYISDGNGGQIQVPVLDSEMTFAPAQVHGISFDGGVGNDSFTNDTAIGSHAFGGSGNDTLVGGRGADVLWGMDGLDTLDGRNGDDVLRGFAGNDTYLFSSAGNRGATLGSDTVYEDANADTDKLDLSALTGVTINLKSTAAQIVKTDYLTLTLGSSLGIEDVTGTSGADKITGNDRPNRIMALGGNDTVNAGAGDDIVYGGDGHDWLYGKAGNDTLHGGAGNDHLYPGVDTNIVTDGSGNDYVDFHFSATAVNYTTGGGNDTVIGSFMADHLTGTSGNDWLEGGVGDDTLSGGSGNDTLLGKWGSNTISDGPGNDLIDFSADDEPVTFTTGGGNDTVIGSSQNDVLTGSSGADLLYGGAGNDRLFGQGGTDVLYGQDGNDWLEAGTVFEFASGGQGTDYNAHKWAKYGTTAGDVMQTGVGDCVFMSALAGGALQGINLGDRIIYQGNYVYNVQLFDGDGNVYNQQVGFDGSILFEDGVRIDPRSAAEGEFWTILYQRAYLEMTANLDVDFKDPEYAMRAVTGHSVDSSGWFDPALVQAALAAGHVVTAGDADDTNKVYAHHSYTVVAVSQHNGVWEILLRNPWGKDVNWDDLGDGTKVAFGSNSDGLIGLSWNSFVGYHDFDRISVS
jgi:Ca2+-binding RTX toxin-like protein